MKSEIIQLNGFLYAVDKEAPCPKNSWAIFPDTTNGKITKYNPPVKCKWDYGVNGVYNLLVVASSDASLGLPLLPAIEKDNREKIYNIIANNHANHSDDYPMVEASVNEILEVVSANKYTEEDMIRAILRGAAFGQQEKGTFTGLAMTLKEGKAHEILQSLNPIPKAIEIECNKICGMDGEESRQSQGIWDMYGCTQFDTCNCQTKPKLKDGYVIVKQWIW